MTECRQCYQAAITVSFIHKTKHIQTLCKYCGIHCNLRTGKLTTRYLECPVLTLPNCLWTVDLSKYLTAIKCDSHWAMLPCCIYILIELSAVFGHIYSDVLVHFNSIGPSNTIWYRNGGHKWIRILSFYELLLTHHLLETHKLVQINLYSWRCDIDIILWVQSIISVWPLQLQPCMRHHAMTDQAIMRPNCNKRNSPGAHIDVFSRYWKVVLSFSVSCSVCMFRKHLVNLVTVWCHNNTDNFYQIITKSTPQAAHKGEMWHVFCEFQVWLMFFLYHHSTLYDIVMYWNKL